MFTGCFFPAILLSVLILVLPVQCAHFLGGTITWRIESVSTNGSLVAIRLSQTYSYVYSSALCDSTRIATNQLLSGSSGSLTCSPSCPSGFAVSAQVYCTDGSIANNIGVGKRSDIIWLPVNTSFTAMYVGSAWGSLTTGGSGWSIATNINIMRRSDTGSFNNPPVSNVVSPLVISLRQRRSVVIPVSDADGDFLRCRWASSSGGVDECSSVCPPSSLPNGTVLYSNCTIDIPGANATGVYAIALMVRLSSSTHSLSGRSMILVDLGRRFYQFNQSDTDELSSCPIYRQVSGHSKLFQSTRNVFLGIFLYDSESESNLYRWIVCHQLLWTHR